MGGQSPAGTGGTWILMRYPWPKKNLKALLHYELFHFRFLFFSRFSHVFLVFSLVFWIPICWYSKREKNERKIKNVR